MAFGLPVVTCPVGGIQDFFENGKMGFLVKSSNVEDLRSSLEKLIVNEALRIRISLYNYGYAKKRFLASIVARRLEKIYDQML
ncbi:glycosyltransferase, partial [Desulfobacteraceae bacterium SEEP-SAG9]